MWRYIRSRRRPARGGAWRSIITDSQLYDADGREGLHRPGGQGDRRRTAAAAESGAGGRGRAGRRGADGGHLPRRRTRASGHLWCHRVADRMEEMAELVAVLVDETMTVAAGGTVYDDKGKVIKLYEARLPAVLEFEVPGRLCQLHAGGGGQKFTQPLPEDHERRGRARGAPRAASRRRRWRSIRRGSPDASPGTGTRRSGRKGRATVCPACCW